MLSLTFFLRSPLSTSSTRDPAALGRLTLPSGWAVFKPFSAQSHFARSSSGSQQISTHFHRN